MGQTTLKENISPMEENTDSLLYQLRRKWLEKNVDKPAAEQTDLQQKNEETPLEAVFAPTEAVPKGAADSLSADKGTCIDTADDGTPVQKDAQPADEEEIEEPLPIDARVEVLVSADKLSVAVNLLPPQNGGAEITNEMIFAALAAAGIKTPVGAAMVSLFVNNRKYNNPFKVSKGTPAVDGLDGTVKDCFPRHKTYLLGVRENGTVDYKETNFVTDITKGTLICEITLPTAFIPGVNVYGEILCGHAGRAAVIPKGRNTGVSCDGLRLEALCGGNLSFKDDAFQVDDVLVIEHNVDNAIGNIKFSGDVVIKGTVCEGYTVDSAKNVTVNGTVEGASIYAGQDIVLTKGINGMNKGVLEAKGNVRGRFFENCTMKAGKNIYAESMMNCKAQADDSIIVKGMRGVIVGGEYVALNLIEAKCVGTQSNVVTDILLGATAEMLVELKRLKSEQMLAASKSEELKKDVAYLEGEEKVGSISEQHRKLLPDRKVQSAIAQMKVSTFAKRIKSLNEEIEQCKHCRLVCNQIFPPVKIKISDSILQIKEEAHGCYFYFAGGEIKKGI